MRFNTLHELRQASGLTQEEAGLLLGMSRSSVSRWERQSSDFRLSVHNSSLRMACRIVNTLLEDFQYGHLRPWFLHPNPDLDDQIPLNVAKEGNLLALFAAARAFVRMGDEDVFCAVSRA